MTATKVHGGSCVSHALACYLSACCGLQGVSATAAPGGGVVVPWVATVRATCESSC